MSEKNFINDENLSWKAKGILTYLINVNENASINELIKVSKDQRSAIYTGIEELKKTGYLQRTPARNKLGRYEAYKNEVTLQGKKT